MSLGEIVKVFNVIGNNLLVIRWLFYQLLPNLLHNAVYGIAYQFLLYTFGNVISGFNMCDMLEIELQRAVEVVVQVGIRVLFFL